MKAIIVDIYNKVMHKKAQELVSGEEATKWASGRNVSDWSDGFDTAMQISADIIACSYKDLQKMKQFPMQEELAVRAAMDRVCCKIVEEQDELIMQAVSEVGFSYITIDKGKVVEAFKKYTATKPLHGDFFKTESLKYPPYKVITKHIEGAVCPICQSELENYQKYCKDCGQKLDWGDKE